MALANLTPANLMSQRAGIPVVQAITAPTGPVIPELTGTPANADARAAFRAGQPANAFAGAKVQAANAEAGANGAITNTTTNPSGATGTVKAAAPPAPAPQPTPKVTVVGGNGIVGFNASQADAGAARQGVAPLNVGNQVLAGGGGIAAARNAFLRSRQEQGQNALTFQQAVTNMLLAHVGSLLQPQQEESATPEPSTAMEAKAYGG